jgi:hypothetical protein
MRSFKEIMYKIAGKLPPELAVNAARVKQVQDPSRPGAETPPKSGLKMVAKMRPNKPQPKTASVSDDLDRGFVSWMEKKAGEDVVKEAMSEGFIDAMISSKNIIGKGGRTASQRLMRASDRAGSAVSRRVDVDAPKRMTSAAIELRRQADRKLNSIGRDIATGASKTAGVKTAMCGADHGKLKPGKCCEKCGKMAKTAGLMLDAKNVAAKSKPYLSLIKLRDGVMRGAEGATRNLSDKVDTLKGDPMYYAKKVRDTMLKKQSSLSDMEHIDNALMEIGGDGKGRSKILQRLQRRGLVSGAKGALLGTALTAGAGALYLKGRKDQRAKTAGVAENQENLDLLDLIKKRMAAGSAMVGDV